MAIIFYRMLFRHGVLFTRVVFFIGCFFKRTVFVDHFLARAILHLCWAHHVLNEIAYK